jgi:hypothetical protein
MPREGPLQREPVAAHPIPAAARFTGMGRLVVLLLVALVAVSSSAVRSSSAGASTRFRTPDAGAACRLERASLVCSSLGSDGSVALRPNRRPAVVSELPWWDAATPVLRSFDRAGVACHLDGNALVCRTGSATMRVDADGFAVSDREPTSARRRPAL